MRAVHSASEEPEDDPLDVLASRIEAGEVPRDPTPEENDAFVDSVLEALYADDELNSLRVKITKAWVAMCVAQAKHMLQTDQGESDE